MNCKGYKKLFSAYLDGDLKADKRRRFEDHLAECEGCASEFADFKRLIALTTSMPQIQPSSSFDRTLRAKLEKVEYISGFRAFLGRRPAVFGIICLLLMTTLGVYAIHTYVINHRSRPGENERMQIMANSEILPTEHSYMGEGASTNFVMPSMLTTRANRREIGDMVTSARGNSQENRDFILPLVTDESMMKDKPKTNYVIRRISLMSASEEAGL